MERSVSSKHPERSSDVRLGLWEERVAMEMLVILKRDVRVKEHGEGGRKRLRKRRRRRRSRSEWRRDIRDRREVVKERRGD
eukprot:304520-Hanusia_phi.AAC.2